MAKQGRTPGTNLKETRHKNTYIDKKINESITALLNDMTILVDNATDEDVTLPEMMDRMYNRILNTEQKIDDIITTGGSQVTCYDGLNNFPPEGVEGVVYVDTNGKGLYLYDAALGAYTPIVDQEDYKISTENINKYVATINGGDSAN